MTPWGISSCTVSCTSFQVFIVQKGCKLCGHGDIFHNPKKNPPHLIIRSSGVESWIQLLHSFPWHLQCQVVSNQLESIGLVRVLPSLEKHALGHCFTQWMESWIQLLHSFLWHLQCQVVSKLILAHMAQYLKEFE